MSRPGPPPLGRRSPPPAVAPPDAGRPRYERGIVEFLDKRFTLAELDAAAARRSLLLLFGVALGMAVVAMSLAVAAAGFVVMLLFAQDFLGLDTAHIAASVLATVGASGATVALYHRLGRRR